METAAVVVLNIWCSLRLTQADSTPVALMRMQYTSHDVENRPNKILDTFSAWIGLLKNVRSGLLAKCLIQRVSNGGKIGCQLTDDC
jgi:hypothetical protein